MRKVMSWLAISLREGSKYISPFNIVYDMKIALNKKMYDKLIENSFYYAPPYYPLYGFAKKLHTNSPVTLTIYEWFQAGMKERFLDYLNNNYPDQNVIDLLKNVENGIGNKFD